jgi:streptogramin lyase
MEYAAVKLPRILLLFSVPFSLAALGGCGGGISPSGSPGGSCSASSSSSTPVSCPARTPVAGVSFNGKALAASQPVSQASVQLYAAGNSGNGSTPAPLLPAAVSTGADGTFTVPAGYTCPSAQTPVYLISRGGQPGAASAANSSLWLMAALGPCGNVNAGGSFVLNEVTTAAAVWALAPFMSSGGNVGASCTNTTGLDNAFLTANSLTNATTGASPGSGIASTLTVPTGKLNTLANALASCTGSSGGDSCASLFNAAATGSGVPSNTLDAALNIAHAPGNNVAAIYALAASSAVFSPVLTAAPPDWMLYNTVSGGGMDLPTSVGIAASGDVWVSSYFNVVSEFSPLGAAIFPDGITGSGINQSYGMALDSEGDVWIANEQTTANSGPGNVTELSPSGQAIASGLTGGGIDFPIAVAADMRGSIWFADYGDSKVTLLDSSGLPVSSSSGWGGASLAFPVALAIDANQNAWVANQAGEVPITKISADGSQVTNYDCDCNGASGIATDRNGNVWVANFYGNSISEVNTCGTLELDAAKGGGVDRPQGIAIDGAGTAWVANYRGNSLSEIEGASGSASGTYLSPSSGFGADASLLEPYSLAIDASGSIWVSNSGKNTLTQFIGIAAPVKTPLAGPPQSP